MYSSFLKNQVPANWKAVSYASRKPLASWFKDLHKRVEFMRKWMVGGHPSAFWLSGFFFPHGFMTGILQTYARKHQKAIDFLKFRFKFVDFKELANYVTKDGTDYQDADDLDRAFAAPQDGAYIYGLYIESARWSSATQTLQEQEPGVMLQTVPIIHFQPFEVLHVVPKALVPEKQAPVEEDGDGDGKAASGQQAAKPAPAKSPGKRRNAAAAPKAADVYAGEEDTDANNPARYFCPVYKTSARAGALSTTGQSTNYILSVATPIDPAAGSEHWTLRGAALLTMHDA
jgi:dynein heavy chain